MSKRSKGRRAKFYIDECVPAWLQLHLLLRGYDALLSKEDLGEKTDDALLLRQAKGQGRVLITLDRGIKGKIKHNHHPGIITIIGDQFNENYVCAALDTLLQWGAKRREDYKDLYIEISENQTSITMGDGKTLVIGSDGSLTLREVNGTICNDRKTIEQYLKTFGVVLKPGYSTLCLTPPPSPKL